MRVLCTARRPLQSASYSGKLYKCSWCRTCALRKRAPHYKALARSWDAPTRPWEVVQCDFIGSLKTAKDGSKYVMTFIDLLTGWPEAFCTKDSTPKTAAELYLYGIICYYGKVDRLHSDREATFLSDLFRAITRRVACKQTFTTWRMPTGNRRVERMHETHENLVSVYISDNHKTWPDLVPIALWTIRSTTSYRLHPTYLTVWGRSSEYGNG